MTPELIDEVFVRFLARRPSETELKLGVEALKAATGDHAKATAALAEYEQQLPAKQSAWEASIGKAVVWQPLAPSDLKSAAGTTLAKQEDHSILVTGTLAKDVYTIVAPVDLAAITGLKLEALADDSLPGKGPGRANNGNFVIHELKVTLAQRGQAGEKRRRWSWKTPPPSSARTASTLPA